MGEIIDKRKEFAKRKRENETISNSYHGVEDFLFSRLNERVEKNQKEKDDSSLMEGSQIELLETYRDVRFFLTDLQQKFIKDLETAKWTTLLLPTVFHEDEDYFKVFIQTAFDHYKLTYNIRTITLATWKTNGDLVFYIAQQVFQRTKESDH